MLPSLQADTASFESWAGDWKESGEQIPDPAEDGDRGDKGTSGDCGDWGENASDVGAIAASVAGIDCCFVIDGDVIDMFRLKLNATSEQRSYAKSAQ